MKYCFAVCCLTMCFSILCFLMHCCLMTCCFAHVSCFVEVLFPWCVVWWVVVLARYCMTMCFLPLELFCCDVSGSVVLLRCCLLKLYFLSHVVMLRCCWWGVLLRCDLSAYTLLKVGVCWDTVCQLVFLPRRLFQWDCCSVGLFWWYYRNTANTHIAGVF
jgi:hypothetical protein